MHTRNARKDTMLEGDREKSKKQGFEFEYGGQRRLHGEGDIGAKT